MIYSSNILLSVTQSSSASITLFPIKILWQVYREKKKYVLVKWNVVCHLKDQGGLEIYDLEIKNRSLLRKWLYKLIGDDGVWLTLLKKKYIARSLRARTSRLA
jgi:hypothetical protein